MPGCLVGSLGSKDPCRGPSGQRGSAQSDRNKRETQRKSGLGDNSSGTYSETLQKRETTEAETLEAQSLRQPRHQGFPPGPDARADGKSRKQTNKQKTGRQMNK